MRIELDNRSRWDSGDLASVISTAIVGAVGEDSGKVWSVRVLTSEKLLGRDPVIDATSYKGQRSISLQLPIPQYEGENFLDRVALVSRTAAIECKVGGSGEAAEDLLKRFPQGFRIRRKGEGVSDASKRAR